MQPSVKDSDLNRFPSKEGTADAIADTDIAVIGMAGRFPGADRMDDFWQNLKTGVDSIGEIPKERWDINKNYDPDKSVPNKTYCKHGGFISDIDMFDAGFFEISPAEAEVLMPQQRLVLEEGWKAFEDAGYAPKLLNNMKCGMFLGIMGKGGYAGEHIYNANSISAARISYFLNLKGPAIALDTACSSSLVAVHLACQSLIRGESDMALAGGVALNLDEKYYIVLSKAQMLSPGGKCRVFDDAADGYVLSDGVGFVVLKKLKNALADRDHIYAVIKGSGINQDGKSIWITAPSPESQKELELEVYEKFRINPETISYVEAHGTGTKLGDAIEINALSQAFQHYTDKKQFCPIGSVKSNIGHTSAASGVISLIKVILALKNEAIPPSIHYETPNKNIHFEKTPFFVNTQLTPWLPKPDFPRRAAISAFSMNGTNAYIVIEEVKRVKNILSEPRFIIILSAEDKARLRRRVENFVRFLKEEAGLGRNAAIDDLSFSLCRIGDPMPQRLAVVVSDTNELIKKLDDYIKEIAVHGLFSGAAGENNSEKNTKSNIEPFIKKCLFHKDITLLAEFWVNGADIDWDLLFYNSHCSTVDLPPFFLNPVIDEKTDDRKGAHKKNE